MQVISEVAEYDFDPEALGIKRADFWVGRSIGSIKALFHEIRAN